MGKATPRMREFAEQIAAYLGIPEPDFDDFDATSAFIDDYKEAYFEERRMSGDYD